MATKAKTILSSLYELGDNPYGLVCQWFTPPPPNPRRDGFYTTLSLF